MSQDGHRRTPPPEDARQLWRAIAAAIAQGLSREALLIIVKEVVRQGPWK
jgi:hypothetical protein